MEFRQLRYFVTLSETGNFARAAEIEHISQSALSQQVARLERQLGVPLVERTSRGSRLTAAGEDILVIARTILSDVARLEAYADSIGKGLAGALRIGSPMYAVTNPGRRAVEREFGRRMTGVELHFENEWSAALTRRLQEGELDLTFTMVGAADAGVQKQVVDDAAAILVMRQDHPLARVATVTSADLADVQVLMYPRDLSPFVYDRLTTPLREAGARLVELREPTLPAAMAQVQDGEGVFVAVPWEVPLVNTDLMAGLVTRPTDADLRYGLWLARRESDLSPLSRAFWDVAAEVTASRLAVR